MSLTKTGKTVLGNMEDEYGAEKGKQVFYASINKGKSGSEDWHKTKLGHKPGTARRGF